MLGKYSLKILSLYSTRSAYCVFHSGLQGILMGSGALHAAQWSIQGNPFRLTIGPLQLGWLDACRIAHYSMQRASCAVTSVLRAPSCN